MPHRGRDPALDTPPDSQHEDGRRPRLDQHATLLSTGAAADNARFCPPAPTGSRLRAPPRPTVKQRRLPVSVVLEPDRRWPASASSVLRRSSQSAPAPGPALPIRRRACSAPAIALPGLHPAAPPLRSPSTLPPRYSLVSIGCKSRIERFEGAGGASGQVRRTPVTMCHAQAGCCVPAGHTRGVPGALCRRRARGRHVVLPLPRCAYTLLPDIERSEK